MISTAPLLNLNFLCFEYAVKLMANILSCILSDIDSGIKSGIQSRKKKLLLEKQYIVRQQTMVDHSVRANSTLSK